MTEAVHLETDQEAEKMLKPGMGTTFKGLSLVFYFCCQASPLKGPSASPNSIPAEDPVLVGAPPGPWHPYTQKVWGVLVEALPQDPCPTSLQILWHLRKPTKL